MFDEARGLGRVVLKKSFLRVFSLTVLPGSNGKVRLEMRRHFGLYRASCSPSHRTMGVWSKTENFVCLDQLHFVHHTYNSFKKKTTTKAWMELESIMLSEISQTVRDKYHMISPLTGT